MEVNEELISVVVPVYNTSKYLDRCITSIVNQSYVKLEIILVNDGSTDDSLEICRKWKEKDSRVVVIDKENGGLVSARISGIEAATGKYIGFVDSDDYIDMIMYEKLYEVKKKSNSDFVYCGLKNCYETINGIRITDDNLPQISGVFDIEDNGISFLKEHIFTLEDSNRTYTGGVCLGIYSKAFIKKAYENVPINCSQGEDLICQIWMIINSRKICILNEVYYYYCIRNNSISHNKNYKKYIEICNMIQTIEAICNNYGILNDIINDVECYMNRLLLLEVNNLNKQLNMELYHFKNESALFGKKVIIYAAGDVGQSYMHQLKSNPHINVVMQVDKNHKKNGIQSPYRILESVYDIVIIAVERKSVAIDIKEELISIGVEEEKIIWSSPILNINNM